jgi:hypothetical protein
MKATQIIMSSKYNIAILGAGWAGCHTGLFVKNKKHNVSIFEKSSNIFNGASDNNQFRHHKGYHYPRSFKTIEMINEFSQRFEQDYGFSLKAIPENYYAISSQSSIIDYGIYEKIFPELKPISDSIFRFTNLSRIYRTNESLIDNNLVKTFFYDQLKGHIKFNQTLPTEHFRKYDWVIDCTNNSYNYIDQLSTQKYVLYIAKNLVEIKDLFSLTIMDGNFCSIYPFYRDNLYTISHVQYSNLNFNLSENDRLMKIQDSFKFFFPEFNKYFTIIDSFIGIKKYKQNCQDASRLLEYSLNNNVISCCISKILSIYEIENILNEIIL